MESYFNEYLVVGGMPTAVISFVTTNDYNLVYSIQKSIMNNYRDDIYKYSPTRNKNKISKMFNLIPSTLSKQNNKFALSAIENKKENFENIRTSLE
jgi:predicted AAA+ superfamily ATPase